MIDGKMTYSMMQDSVKIGSAALHCIHENIACQMSKKGSVSIGASLCCKNLMKGH